MHYLNITTKNQLRQFH